MKAFPFDLAIHAARHGGPVRIMGEDWTFSFALTGPGPGPNDVAFRLEGTISGEVPEEGTVPPADHVPDPTLMGVVAVLGHMIRRHYHTDEGVVGGLLHVQLDDDNVEDCFWEDPFSQEVRDIWERPPTMLEEDIAALMQTLPYEYRVAALKDAKERGTWG